MKYFYKFLTILLGIVVSALAFHGSKAISDRIVLFTQNNYSQIFGRIFSSLQFCCRQKAHKKTDFRTLPTATHLNYCQDSHTFLVS